MTSVEQHNAVYVAADTAGRSKNWSTLWALRELLRETESWINGYGPWCAVAAWYVDRPAGQALLDEVIAAGFHQPEMFADEFTETFATEPGWDERLARMRANVPPPPVELLDWPDHPPMLRPVLERLPADREELLREHLPEPASTAWETATGLLDWVTTRWEHGNGHVDRKDAVEILSRVVAGERFACVEYSVVLTQALNAVGIPARRLGLLMHDHHAGFGRGHVVSEAWIDELGRWVLLDGQNGAWWGASEPLGVLELMERYRDGDRPPMNSRHRDLDEASQSMWFRHFAAATTTGLAWSKGPFVPVFQSTHVVMSDRLVHGTDQVAPDLARIGTAVVDDGGPALRFSPVHPFAVGVQVRSRSGPSDVTLLRPDESIRLSSYGPGDHDLDVGTVTPYAVLAGSPLRFLVR